MKAGIHPEYREVVFQDVTSDFKILTRSTLASKETVKWEDGNEYPLIKVEVSSSSHPFYTGQNKVIDTSGRVDKFRLCDNFDFPCGGAWPAGRRRRADPTGANP